MKLAGKAFEEHRARRRARSIAHGALALTLVGSVVVSCNLDPVQHTGVDALGEERSDLYVPESEYHRPGEPCLQCHAQKGPAESRYVVAGTIFWGPNNYERRVDNAYVRILDANKTTKCFVTNCNGNFFVAPEQFQKLTFPLLVSVERVVDPANGASPTLAIRRMAGHIGREGSCGACHLRGLQDFGSPGQVRLFDSEKEVDDLKLVSKPCPNPDVPSVRKCPEDR